MQRLSAVSSRAQINPTSFVNEYNWGDFKGENVNLTVPARASAGLEGVGLHALNHVDRG